MSSERSDPELPGDLALRTRGLAKTYRIRPGGGSASIKDDLARIFSLDRGRSREREFRALDGVDLDVRHGEIIGLLGSNGAGKSTLLKLLCRITAPTGGWIAWRGRVAAVLEVGTGFHPELSGRENIWLNGAILGMSRREIGARFDAIVDFAGIGDFLDEPVKRYSSGMHVRLAFAVAANLDPDILVVDEVLAVGDEPFRAKCLDQLRRRFSDRTVILVSHDMDAIASICTRAVILHAGRVAFAGAVDEAIARYREEAGAPLA